MTNEEKPFEETTTYYWCSEHNSVNDGCPSSTEMGWATQYSSEKREYKRIVEDEPTE